jgi:hypothetical protein
MNNGLPNGGGWKHTVFWLAVFAAVVVLWYIFMKNFAGMI